MSMPFLYLSTARQKNFLSKSNFLKEDTAPNTHPKILLIEDTKTVQIVHTILLKSFGCKVDLAQTGQEALSMFNQAYDLIFVDIGLPDMRGTDIAKYIRNFEAKNKLKKRNTLVALTAFGEEVRGECINAGMDDIFYKPIAQQKLKNILIKWLPFALSKNLKEGHFT